MGHLDIESLARLVSEAPSPEEEQHLEACSACRFELRALKEQTESIGSLPDLRPPTGDWEALEARLVSEGLIRSSDLARRASRWWSSGWIQAAAGLVLDQVRHDLQTDISYQMEYNWSGNFADREIFLVDDGRANGVSCTDYLLVLLEEQAGVCIHGSRISAREVEEYFRFDPVGSTVAIPDEWNPFPFPVTVADVLDMGYYAVDPPPHVFPCDNSTETGLPTPARLINSPQLVDIVPAPVPAVYDSWVPEQMEDEAKWE